MPLGILDIRWIKNDLGFYLENHSCAYTGLSFWNEIFIQAISPRDQVGSSDLRINKYSATQRIPERYFHTKIFDYGPWVLWLFLCLLWVSAMCF